tara:strand:+ start:814 stop:1404 length:591 start_codon:yes stop_codon:yes gene_type:complete
MFGLIMTSFLTSLKEKLFGKKDSNAERLASVTKLAPGLFEAPGKLLYVGARHDRMEFGKEFQDAGHKFTILEIYEPNVKHLTETCPWATVIQGDVRNLENFSENQFDYTFWWHGPEHIKEEELTDAVLGLENITKKIVVLGCPWGVYPQHHLHGNPHEEHEASLYPHHFEAMGYVVDKIGAADKIGSNLAAVKHLQ